MKQPDRRTGVNLCGGLFFDASLNDVDRADRDASRSPVTRILRLPPTLKVRDRLTPMAREAGNCGSAARIGFPECRDDASLGEGAS
ncbi:MAG TPA: hypothetical protein PK093_01810 [Phycisphaerae bacterium]|nr:hypothetical protein [Phycisphaerae bacterium]